MKTTHKNPLNKIRSPLTIEQFAKELEVSKSVIQRALEGSYPTLSEKFLKKLSKFSSLSVGEIEKEYAEFQKDCLSQVILPSIKLYRNSTIEEWNFWAYHASKLNGVTNTATGMGKLLKLNPAVIMKWESAGMNRIPLGILNRIEEINELRKLR